MTPTAPPPPPPHSLETEQQALACMLSSVENVKQGLSILTKEHFHLIQHQDIFESMEHIPLQISGFLCFEKYDIF